MTIGMMSTVNETQMCYKGGAENRRINCTDNKPRNRKSLISAPKMVWGNLWKIILKKEVKAMSRRSLQNKGIKTVSEM